MGFALTPNIPTRVGTLSTFYAVALAYGRRRDGRLLVLQHVFNVSGRHPLTKLEAVARARTACEAEWDTTDNGPITEFGDPAWALSAWVTSIGVPLD
jgi:hypothetical protein